MDVMYLAASRDLLFAVLIVVESIMERTPITHDTLRTRSDMSDVREHSPLIPTRHPAIRTQVLHAQTLEKDHPSHLR